MKRSGYGVLAPRSPNIKKATLIDKRWKISNDKSIIKAGLIGSHFRMCERESALKAFGDTFGPIRRELWIMRQLHNAKIKTGFLLDLIVFDLGHWTQGYMRGSGRHRTAVQTVVELGKEFLATGWSSKYTEEQKLGIVKGVY